MAILHKPGVVKDSIPLSRWIRLKRWLSDLPHLWLGGGPWYCKCGGKFHLTRETVYGHYCKCDHCELEYYSSDY